jgi:hypothetical protein
MIEDFPSTHISNILIGPTYNKDGVVIELSEYKRLLARKLLWDRNFFLSANQTLLGEISHDIEAYSALPD